MANEEPLVVMEACVDVVREIVRENCGDSRGGVVWEGETSLRRSGCRSVREGASGAEDRDIGCDRSISGRRGLEVFATRRGNENVVGVNGDVFVEWGKKEGVENFLRDSRRGGQHGR